MNRAVACYSLGFLALSAAPHLAADTDTSLIERLETAETRRAQYDILNLIVERAADKPFSTELTDRLIVELMSEEAYNNHHIMRTLPQLAGERGFSEQSLLHLAKALSDDMTRTYDPARSIAKILSAAHENSGLSDEAFSELIKALGHLAMLNRSAAIEVLAATRPEDSRYAIAMENISSVLNMHEHQHTRSSAIAGLARLTRNQAMPPDVLQGLVRITKSDPYMTVRMDALELLAQRDIDEPTRTELTTALSEEIVSPTPETWTRSRGLRAHNALGDRATEVMEKLHQPPYPSHVTDAWIAQTTGHLPEKSLAALRRAFLRGELSNSQMNTLRMIAEAHRRPEEREMVYATLFVELRAGTLMDALVGFENADYETDRIRAAYTLKEQFRGKDVPNRVADAAARVAIGGSNAELRAIAAGLLSNAQRDQRQSESLLIRAVLKHPEDYEIHAAILNLYGPDRLDKLVVKYATDSMLPVSFRRRIIQELGQLKETEAGLSPGAENTLKEVARHAEDYHLVQDAGSTLKAWGISPPLRVALQNHGNQSKALFVVLVGLVITNIVAAIVGLISVFRLPLKSRNNRLAIRTGTFIAWFALTAGILVLLGAGAIGFLGHNWAPSPKATLLWNLPAYAGTLTYVFLTLLFWRNVRSKTVQAKSLDGSRE